MKRIYTSPVCEVFLTEQEETLQVTSAYTSSGDPGGYLPFDDPNIPVDNGDNGGGGDIGPGDFAKGGMVWDNTLFD